MNVFCVVLTLNVPFKLKCTLYILLAPLCFCLLCREKEKPDEGGHLEGGGGGQTGSQLSAKKMQVIP